MFQFTCRFAFLSTFPPSNQTPKITRILTRAYSVKIGVIFGVRFERRKVDKKANLHEN